MNLIIVVDGQRAVVAVSLILIDSKLCGASSYNYLDLRQVPSDLSHFRRRIDDSIREQRRTREIVEEAQDKLRNLRQHQAQVEASLTSGPSTPRFFPTDYRYSKNKRYYHHRSMSSLDEELTSKVFTTGGDRERIRLDEDTRPSSSGGRLKPTSHERG